MLLGYNTNGFAHHRFEDALAILAELGYKSVAITLDHHTINPLADDLPQRVEHVRQLLNRYGLHSVIETGARFLLDPRQKHEPTLVSSGSSDRARRISFLRQAIDIAAALNSDAVSFWSGCLRAAVARQQAMKWLVAGCQQVLDQAVSRNVRLAFEPEPGMFIERMADFAELSRSLDQPLFGLTIDVGHVHCLNDGAIPDALAEWSSRLFNIHIEDMRVGVHEHLMFGDGEIDFAALFSKLLEIEYGGGVHVELSRHSHDAVNAATRAFQFLKPFYPDLV
jgi:sugar phosphate isomerase/epimerase